MWHVYILRSTRDNDLYVGLTNDLGGRLKCHNQGKVFSTRLRIPLILIYYEAHRNTYDAAAHERFLKTGWGKNWIKRTLKNYFQSKKLGGQISANLFEKVKNAFRVPSLSLAFA